MIRKSLYFLLCLLLLAGGLALAQDNDAANEAASEAVNQATNSGGNLEVVSDLSPLPSDPRFDQFVSLNTGTDGIDIGILIGALAQSVGLSAVISDVPKQMVVYDIGEKPFRQVWKILLSLNGLDYVLEENNVVIVGSANQVSVYNQREPVVLPTYEQRFYKVSNAPEQYAIALQLALPEADVEAIPGISTISVRATPLDHGRVSTILADIDPPTAPMEQTSREQQVYSLSNARATELAETLRESGTILVEMEGQAADGADGANTQASTGAEFTIVPDARTNSLIINATPTQHQAFAALIPKLDIPQQQVNVQIRIQEINKHSAQNIGIDLSGGLANFTFGTGSTGLDFIFNASKAVSSLNIGAVLDAFERQGLSRRVDDANITVLNNGEGSIQSGGTIFISIAGGSENIEREVPYGVQIDVSPQIAADGRINMSVSAKVDSLLSETENPAFLNIGNKNVRSEVTLVPGQTIVLGGLFQNQFTESTEGVPILSSLPFVGGLFNTTRIEERDTELLLVITATIIE